MILAFLANTTSCVHWSAWLSHMHHIVWQVCFVWFISQERFKHPVVTHWHSLSAGVLVSYAHQLYLLAPGGSDVNCPS